MKKMNHFFAAIKKRPSLTLYILLLMVCILFTVYVGITERPAVYSPREGASVTVMRDIPFEKIEDKTAPQGVCYRFRTTITHAFVGEEYLAYRMVHEYTEVRLGGQLLFSLRPSDTNRFGSTAGNTWGMIPLYSSDIGKELEIRIYPAYKGVNFLPDEFLIGEKSDIVAREVSLAIPSFILSLVAVLVGVIFMIISRLTKFSSHESGMALRCLGFFSVLLGCWRLSDMRVTTLLLHGSSIFMSYVTLLSLMLIPVPLSFFLWIKLRLSRKALHFITGSFLVIDTVIMLMQLTGLRDIRENLLLIHASDIAAMALVFLFVIIARVKYRSRLDLGFRVWVVLLVFAGIAADLIEYYFVSNDRNMIWTVLSVDLYVIVTGINYIIRMRNEASVDTATGIYNKNRCQERINTPGPAPAGTMFIMLDLNGLKHANDTLGHENGDKMIRLFAEALKKTFERERDFIGRFGGDEFIVILENVSTREEADAQIARLKASVSKIQEANPDVTLSYSSGYCLEAENRGENLDYMLRRADMEMYRQKRLWHEQH